MTKTASVAAKPASSIPQGSGHGWHDAAQEWRANWRVGLAMFLAIGLSFGSFHSLSSLFVLPLQEAFGWSRSEIAFAYNAAIVTAFASPLVGRAIDRFGPRGIMLGGMALSVVIYSSFTLMNGSLVLFYLLSVLASVIGLSASGLTCSRVVSQTFIRSRGLSLAIARSGLALGSAGLPVILFTIIAHLGWRAGYLTQAALVACIAIPAVYFWIGRDSPVAGSARARSAMELPRWGELARNRHVWLVCLGAGLGYAPAVAIMSQLQPLLVGKGIDGGNAAMLIGVAGMASFVGALVTGALVDRFWAPAVAFIFACGAAAGACILAFYGTLDAPIAAGAVLLVGLGLGAEIDVVAFLVARYFGVRNFSTLYGVAVFFIAISGAAGASLLGVAFDTFGNYDLALFILAGCFVLAGCCYLLLGPYPATDEAE